MNRVELIARIEALLPQTQCRQCGYAGCRPYAQAIVDGDAGINQCPPGGDDGARELARLTNAPYAAVDPSFGVTKPPSIAIIDETRCIGCTLCLEACPVDAIVGAAKLMHTIISDHCTGCELCLPPCPVDCISLQASGVDHSHEYRRMIAAQSKQRFERRIERLAREQAGKDAGARSQDTEVDVKVIESAIARARQRLATLRLREK